MWIARLGSAEADIMGEWFEPGLPNVRVVLEIPFGRKKGAWIPQFFGAFAQIVEDRVFTRCFNVRVAI